MVASFLLPLTSLLQGATWQAPFLLFPTPQACALKFTHSSHDSSETPPYLEPTVRLPGPPFPVKERSVCH
jgi:hypothetical protein